MKPRTVKTGKTWAMVAIAMLALAAGCSSTRMTSNELHTARLEDQVQALETSQTRRGRVRVALVAAPIDIGPTMRKELFEKIPTVVLTSATLSTGQKGNFDYFKARVGLTQSGALHVGSPFNYRECATLITVRGMPDPATERAAYEVKCVQLIERHVARTAGRAFVLFTSYDAMHRTASSRLSHDSRQSFPRRSSTSGQLL